MKKIVSFDIGYLNMAFVEVETNFDDIINVINFHKINLHKFNENEVHNSMSKFIKIYENIFINADIILIERQPPTGLNNIQDILAFNYSSKIKLISPRSMHKYFYISKLNYEDRKKYTEKISKIYLEKFNEYNILERKHDISDAFCICLYYIKINRIIKPIKIDKNLNTFFDSFCYLKN